MASAQSSKKRHSDEGVFIPPPKLVKVMEPDETMPIAEPVGWVDPSEVLDCVEIIAKHKFEWVLKNCVVFDWMVPDWMEEKQIETEVYEWAQSQPEENLICVSTLCMIVGCFLFLTFKAKLAHAACICSF
jgi:hypothetical protein